MSAAAVALATKKRDREGLWESKLPRVEEAGHTQFPNRHLIQLYRLTSGAAEQLLILTIARYTLSAPRDRGTPAPEFSEPFNTESLTWWAIESASKSPITKKQHESNLRTVQYAIERLLEAGIIERKAPPGGNRKRGTPNEDKWQYRVSFEAWDDLPDYVAKKGAASAESLDSSDPEEEEEEASARPQWKGKFLSNGTRQPAVELSMHPDHIRPPVCKNGEIEVEARVLKNGTLEQEVRILSFSEGKAKHERNGFRHDSEVVETTGSNLLRRGSAWDDFLIVASALECPLSYSEPELTHLKRIWAALPDDERFEAINGIHKRRTCGQWDDVKFRPTLLNYLRYKQWQHALRPKNGARNLVADSHKLLDELERR